MEPDTGLQIKYKVHRNHKKKTFFFKIIFGPNEYPLNNSSKLLYESYEARYRLAYERRSRYTWIDYFNSKKLISFPLMLQQNTCNTFLIDTLPDPKSRKKIPKIFTSGIVTAD